MIEWARDRSQQVGGDLRIQVPKSTTEAQLRAITIQYGTCLSAIAHYFTLFNAAITCGSVRATTMA